MIRITRYWKDGDLEETETRRTKDDFDDFVGDTDCEATWEKLVSIVTRKYKTRRVFQLTIEELDSNKPRKAIRRVTRAPRGKIKDTQRIFHLRQGE